MSIQKINKAINIYIKSQTLIFLVNTLIFWIVLAVLNLKFALIWALLTGVLSLVPIFGISVSALIVFIVSLIDGQSFSSLHPVLEGLIFILVYIIFNQLVDLVISPFILGKTIKISPLILFITVILATSVFGIFGAFLAVPVLILLKVYYGSQSTKTNKKSKDYLGN